MNTVAVFIVYFGIKETLFHRDTGASRGQYNSIVLYSLALYCNSIVLYCIAWHFIVIVLYCIVWHCIALVLYCIV